MNAPLANKFSYEDLWNFSITNNGTQIEKVYLFAKISLEGFGEVSEARTMILELLPGVTSISERSLSEINYKFFNTQFEQSVKNTKNFPKGEYKICLSAVRVTDDIELVQKCIRFTITKESNESNKSNEPESPVKFSGYGEIFGNYSDRQGYNQEIPPNYIQFNLSSTLSVFNLPFSGSMLASTLQSEMRQDINMYNLSFDAAQFKNNLRKIALQDFLDKDNIEKPGDIRQKSVWTELNGINQKLKHPQIRKELERLEKISEIEEKIKNTTDQDIIEKLNKYLEKDSLLLRKRNGYDRLLQRKNELDKLNDKYPGPSDYMDLDLNDLPKILSELDKLENELKIAKDSSGKREIEEKLQRYEFFKTNRKKLERLYKNKNQALEIKEKFEGVNINEIKDFDINNLPEILKKIDKLENELRITKDTIRKREIEKRLNKFDKIRKNRNKLESLYRNKERFDKLKSEFSSVQSTQKLSSDNLSDLADPDLLKTKLLSMGKLNRFEKFIYNFNKFNIGTSYPLYSEFTLSNVPVNGFTTELDIDKFYLTFTYGKLKKTVISIDPYYSSYQRKIISGGLGYGRKNGTHLHFHVISIDDDSSSIAQKIITDSNTFNYHSSPQSNKILSCELRFNMLKDKVWFEGELAGSQTIGDKWLRPGNEIMVDSNLYNNFSGTNEWFNNILRQKSPNLNTSIDYAYRIKLNTDIKSTHTRFELSAKRVGENFQSLGVPYLIRDVITYELRFRQYLLKRKIALSGFVKRDGDNIEGFHVLTTNLMRFGFEGAIRIPKLPYLRINLTPVIHKNDSQSYRMNVFTISTGYQYKIGKLTNISNIAYNRQRSEISIDDWSYMIEYYTISHVLRFKKPVALNINLNLINNEVHDSVYHGYNYSLAANYIFRRWNNAIGINTLINRDQDEKWGFFYQSSISFARYFNFDFRIERNIYDNYLNREFLLDYKEILVKASLNIKW